MSDLDRSIDYYRKICMIKENIVPTQTEVKYRMGDALANVLFDSILPALKPYLGVSPPLNGPGDDLWLSPSDLLIGKVKLKPPLTSKHIKALTHQGILDIGWEVEQKRDHEYQLDKEKALIEKELIIKYMAAKELREAVARAKEEKDRETQMIVAQLQEDFKEELEYELQNLTAKLKIEQDIAVEAGKLEKEAEMQVKLEIAVQDTVCRMTEQFAKELYKVSKKLHEHFWHHIRREKKKLKEAIHFEQLSGQQKLEQLRAELQCENIANIMYVLANERRRCICEKQAIENNFIARLSVLEKEQEERNEKLIKSIRRYELAGQKIKVREAVLFDIIKQFQKFIYFVLRAVPMQAEYLLNVEQLMIFELTKTVLDSKPELYEEELAKIEEEEIAGEGGEKTPGKAGTDVTDRTSFQLLYNGSHIASSRSGGGNVTEIEAYRVDYHNCDNVSRCDSIDRSLKENEDLPYFLFNENLYVREDFRNMISQGIKISKSHELWSYKNAEIMEQIAPEEGTVTTLPTEEEEESATLQERINAATAVEAECREQSLKKSAINVRFSQLQRTAEKFEDEEVLGNQIYSANVSAHEVPHPTTRRVSDGGKRSSYSKRKELLAKRTSVESTKSIEGVEAILGVEKPSKLVLARDSVDLLVEKTLQSEHAPANKILGLKSRNSFISHTRKSFDGKLTGTKEIVNRPESKIELHRDSVELIKEKESVQVKTSTEASPMVCKTRNRSIGVQCDSIHKTVGISHIEIIPDDSKRKVSIVSFHNETKIIPDELSTISEEVKKLPLYHRPPTENRIYRPPEQPFKIIGDKNMTEYLQTQDEFTAKRVSSFIRIFKNSPSLRDLFTEAAKN